LVIQAEPYGETEVTVFDADFLPAPPGPAWEVPEEPPAPAWVPLTVRSEACPSLIPPISLPELPA